MRTAIVTDSNSGILPEEAEARGIYLLNMPIIAGDREYLENESRSLRRLFQPLHQ